MYFKTKIYKKAVSAVLAILMAINVVPVYALGNDTYEEPENLIPETIETENPTITPYTNSVVINFSLSNTNVSGTSACLSWDYVAEAAYYDINCNNMVIVPSVLENSYDLTGLENGKLYTIVVNAYNSEGILIGTSNEVFVYNDFIVNEETILHEDITVENLYINRDYLNLNGHTITVKGNLILSGGSLFVNNGQLFINGDFRIQNETVLSDGSKAYNYSYGVLKMLNRNDNIIVNGDFVSDTYGACLYKSGTMEIKGHFTQLNGTFMSEEDHKIILSGEKYQTVYFQNRNSSINVLEIRNYSDEGVLFNSNIYIADLISNGCKISYTDNSSEGWILEQDEVYDGDLSIGAGELNLNGHKLTVNGNLFHTGGTIFVNNGSLEINGDYKVQSVDGTASNGILKMIKESDHVLVNGNFVMQSSKSHNGYLSAGTFELKGDFSQLNSCYSNFFTSGNHRTTFSGEKKQTITFYNSGADNSHFNSLEITNKSPEGIEFVSPVYILKYLYNTDSNVVGSNNIYLYNNAKIIGGKWNYDIRLSSDNNGKVISQDMEIGGTLYISGGTANLNGKTITVNENLIFHNGTLNISNGQLIINGDFRQQSEYVNSNGEKTYSGTSNTTLIMQNADGYILVNGSYYVQNNQNTGTGYLNNGIIEIKGDFSQLGNYKNFYATNLHKVILSGEDMQIVSFDSTTSKFAELEAKNYSDGGIYFKTIYEADKFIDNGCTVKCDSISDYKYGWRLEKDQTIDGDLNLVSGTLDLAGHKLTVTGNFTQSGGTVHINEGELEINGNYSIQTVNGSICSGILKMTNDSDIVTVLGDFIINSRISGVNNLTAGNMNIGGNFAQLGLNTSFCPSLNHTIVFNGIGNQTISFVDGTNSFFNNIKFDKDTSDEITFLTKTTIKGKLYNSQSVMNNCQNLYLAGNAILADGKWDHSLSIGTYYSFNSDVEIGDSIFIMGGVTKLNGNTIKVNGDVIVSVGSLIIDGGKLYINNDFRIQSVRFYGNNDRTYSYATSAYLEMDNSSDYICVNGNVVIYTFCSSILNEGTLEIKGDFNQFIVNYNRNTCETNFIAQNNHKVILSGDSLQNITFQSKKSYFAILDLRNYSSEGICFTPDYQAAKVIKNGCKTNVNNQSYVSGWTLEDDEIYDGDLILGMDELNLAGYKLTVTGDLKQVGGIVNINGGKLEVLGNYTMQSENGNGATLIMTNNSDFIKIHGDLTVSTNVSHSNFLTAGTLELGGNYKSASSNFSMRGTHKIIFNGNEKQLIENTYNTYFNILEIANTSDDGVEFASSVYVSGGLKNTDSKVSNSEYIYLTNNAKLLDNAWNYNLNIQNGTLKLYDDTFIGENILLNNASINLNGKKLDVKGSIVISYSSTVYVNGGSLIIGENLYQGSAYIYNGVISNISSSNDCILKMSKSSDYVLVNGNYYVYECNSTSDCLTNGVIELKGNFEHKVFSADDTFMPSGSHRFILSGELLQTVCIDGNSSKFAALELKNKSEEGVVFNSDFRADSFISNDCKYSYGIGSINEDKVYDGDLIISEDINLNGYTLTVNGNVIHESGTVFINEGTLCVNGDYKIQTASEGYSSGILKMTKEADKVIVCGDFVMLSNKSHKGFLKAGVLEVGGDFTQLGHSENFRTSGSHLTILNGTKHQQVSFSNSGDVFYSNFNNLKIMNSSSKGAEILRPIYVTGSLSDTSSNLTKSYNLYLGQNATLEDKRWEYDLRISQDKIFSDDIEVGGTLYIDGGTIDLNGKTVTVDSNVIMSGGALKINGGRLIVKGDLRQQKEAISNDGAKTYSFASGHIIMNSKNDCVKVFGDYVTNGNDSYNNYHNNYMTNGIIEIEGNLKQLTNNSDRLCFFASGNHRVNLCGKSAQTVSADNKNIKFATLELKNTSENGVAFTFIPDIDNFIKNDSKYSFNNDNFSWTLNSDEEYDGDLIVDGQTLNLNGHTLAINGNLILEDGVVFVNGGTLSVNGNFIIEKNGGKESSGKLRMIKQTDLVKVNGDFVMHSKKSHNGSLSAGTLIISGNFKQINSNLYNFKATGTHMTIFDGSEKQSIYFNYPGELYSCFKSVNFANTSEEGIELLTNIYITGEHELNCGIINPEKLYLGSGAVLNSIYDGNVKIAGNVQLTSDVEIKGSLYISSGAVDLNGYNLKINNNVILSGGTLFVNGGKLFVDNDLRMQSETTKADGTVFYYDAYNSSLKMNNNEDYILVNGNVVVQENSSQTSVLTNGIIEIKGDFTQLVTYKGDNFVAEENHKVILSGEKLQTVSFDSNLSKFAALEIANLSADGVIFNTNVISNKLIVNDGCNLSYGTNAGDMILEQDEIYDGDFIVSNQSIDLNGHKLTVNGNILHNGGTMFINGGELVVNGDYLIQKSENNSGNGILKMTNDNDAVKVSGNFVMNSNVSHNGLLTAGTLEIGGDFTQRSGAYDSFKTSGTHRTVLNGTEKQIVYLGYGGIIGVNYNTYNDSCFNILEMTNTSEDGIVFNNNVYVIKEVKSGTLKISNPQNLYLCDGIKIVGNTWGGSLCLTNNYNFENDFEIKGSLYINDGIIKLNGNTVTVNDNLIFSKGTLDISKGSLLVNGDYRQQKENSTSAGTVNYSNSYQSYLKMINAEDYVRINGNYISYESYKNRNYLSDGVLEIKGDFYQNKDSFPASGDHKTVLSGDTVQNITFNYTNTKFNILEITKPYSSGYVFNYTPAWIELIEQVEDDKNDENDTVAPTIPDNLVIAASGTSSVILTWDNSSDDIGVVGYNIYRNGKRIAYSSTNKYADSDLLPNTVYTYAVSAYDKAGNCSGQCAALEFITEDYEYEYTISSPQDLKAVVNQNDMSVTVTWSKDTSDNSIKGYKVYRDGINIGKASGVSYTDKNAVPYGQHTYYVEAYSENGIAASPSNKAAINNQRPDKPVITVEKVINNMVFLNWTDDKSGNISYYELYRNGSGSPYSRVSSNSFTDSNIITNNTYYYTVVAVNKFGNRSETSDRATVNFDILAAPIVKSISPYNNRYSKIMPITVDVKDNMSVSSVTVQYSYDRETWHDIETIKADGKSNSSVNCNFDVSELEEGIIVLRAFAINSRNIVGNAEKSPTVENYIDHTAPQKPVNVKTLLDNGAVEIRWDKPSDNDTSTFNVYRKTSSETSYSLIKNNITNINYFDKTVQMGVEYSYKVTAADDAGNESSFSEEVTAVWERDEIAPEIVSVSKENNASFVQYEEFEVLCKDNYKLSRFTVERRAENEENWTKIYSASLNDSAEFVYFVPDMNNYDEGTYEFRMQTIDANGNGSEYEILTLEYVKTNISVPLLTAVGSGWSVQLKWEIENAVGLNGFYVYQKNNDTGRYEHIAVVDNSSRREYMFSGLTPGVEYCYYIEAVDNAGNAVKSNEASAVPTIEDDEKPVANAGSNQLSFVGKTVSFDGSSSYDDHYIASYKWDFGDGETSMGAKTSHLYNKAGKYQVSLSVEDSYGNIDTEIIEVTVYDSSYNSVKISVRDDTGKYLQDVMIYCDSADIEDDSYYTDSNGRFTFIGEDGDYELYFYKKGYMPKSQSVTIGNNTSVPVIVTLKQEELITGKLTSRPLELGEIIDSGIDISDPDNQFVFEYSVDLYYSDDGSTKTWTFALNSKGEPVGRGSTKYNMHCPGSDGSSGGSSYVYSAKGILDEKGKIIGVAILRVNTQISWLKEFFEVELTVYNNAGEEFSIENSYATLNLPDGLSLADTARNEKITQKMGTIEGGKNAFVSWIVRGDKKGEYYLTADFNCVLTPFMEDVHIEFKNEKPLVVYGGNALQLDVDYTGFDPDTDYWTAKFTLTNISDKPVYDVNIDFHAYKYFDDIEISDMVIKYPSGLTIRIPWTGKEPDYDNQEEYLPVLWVDDEESEIYKRTLMPGESITGYYSVSNFQHHIPK